MHHDSQESGSEKKPGLPGPDAIKPSTSSMASSAAAGVVRRSVAAVATRPASLLGELSPTRSIASEETSMVQKSLNQEPLAQKRQPTSKSSSVSKFKAPSRYQYATRSLATTEAIRSSSSSKSGADRPAVASGRFVFLKHGSPIIATWDTPVTLLSLSPNFPLSPCHEVVVLSPDRPLGALLRDLSNAFYFYSLQVDYKSKPACAALYSMDHVEMFLRLFQKSETQVVVEVVRRSGESMRYRTYVDAIRRVSIHGMADFQDEEQELPTPPACLTKEQVTALQRVEQLTKAIPSPTAFGLRVQEWTTPQGRLKSTYSFFNQDPRRFLESFLILIDPWVSGISTASEATQVVLLGRVETDQPESYEIMHEFFWSILISRTVPEGADALLSDDDDYMDSDEEDFFGHFQHDPRVFDSSERHTPQYYADMHILHSLVLEIVARAMLLAVSACFSKPELSPSQLIEHVHATVEKKIHSDLVATLLQELQRANSSASTFARPHQACWAARCLRCMATVSPEVKARILRLGGANWTKQALDVGKASHAQLQQESQQLLSLLEEAH